MDTIKGITFQTSSRTYPIAYRVVIRRNFKGSLALDAPGRREKFRILLHELGHVAGFDEERAGSLDLKCARRDLTAEDRLHHRPIPSLNVPLRDLTCTTRSEWVCHRFTLLSAPPWPGSDFSGDAQDPDDPWCGWLGITHGQGSYSAFACVGHAIVLCWPELRTVCGRSAAAPAQSARQRAGVPEVLALGLGEPGVACPGVGLRASPPGFGPAGPDIVSGALQRAPRDPGSWNRERSATPELGAGFAPHLEPTRPGPALTWSPRSARARPRGLR